VWDGEVAGYSGERSHGVGPHVAPSKMRKSRLAFVVVVLSTLNSEPPPKARS
jgi:hypothetical protein